MKPIEKLSFQIYSARMLEPLEKQFELLVSLGCKLVEPFGGLFGDPARLKALLQKHDMKAPTAHVGLDRLRADAKAAVALCRDIGVEAIFAPAPPTGEPDARPTPFSAPAAVSRASLSIQAESDKCLQDRAF